LFSSCSIRLRITLWYVLTVALILGASGLFWYLSLSRTLQSEIDERLQIIAETVAGQLQAGVSDLDPGEFCGQLTQRQILSETGALLRIYAKDGTPWCESSPGLMPDGEHAEWVAAVAAASTSRLLTLERPGDPRLRVLDYPLLFGSEIHGLIRIGVSMEPADRILDHLSLIFLLTFPLPLAALALGGWFLADRALAPVETSPAP
jgi:hypothetical protein